ncbi:response regulator [Mucilaginibacter hurinus]|uniref:Response regulator n=1 Tax=Mucilaginibacter hurinus TaxID=2201324 RepID=A0A367GMQ3_9SPHI|nr:response regulator [Mucilaginibacter hurinus]RCH54739.1 response regulator [Mucilaginibacter hurinus]
MKILVIEDNDDILEIITMVLESQGHDVRGGQNGKMINEAETFKPNLILMDNHLPDGSGADFCLKIKENDKTRNIPVVLISANIDLATLSSSSRADGFLPKPFDLDELVKLVNKFDIAN